MLAHQTPELFVVHDQALLSQRRPHTAIAVALELIADREHRLHERGVVDRRGGPVIVGRARDAHQPASLRDGQAAGPMITEGSPLLGRGACFSAPFRNSSSSACLPTNRSSAAIRDLIYLDQVGRLRLVIEGTLLILAHPDADQIARQVMPLRQAMQRLAGDEFLRDLALELDAVTAMLGHGLSSLRKPGRPVKSVNPICPPPGAHSRRGSFLLSLDRLRGRSG